VELPAGAVCEALLEQECAGLHAFAAQLRSHLQAPPRPPHAMQLPFELDGERWTLQAEFPSPRASGLVHWRYDTPHAGDHLEAWITHLAWLAAGVPEGAQARTVWCGRGAGLAFGPVAEPKARLLELLQLYRRGLTEPLAFFPRTAWALVTQSRSKAHGAWRGRPGAGTGEREDPSTRLAWRGRPDPLEHDFATVQALAHQVFGPLRAHLEEA
jgi:exodeoxyribonuclease V gamma subunit